MTQIKASFATRQDLQSSFRLEPPQERLRGGASSEHEASGSRNSVDARVNTRVDNPFVHPIASSSSHVWRNDDLEDDYTSRVLPGNWRDGGRYPLNPETTDAETIANLEAAALIFHDVFVAPFVPDNSIHSLFAKAEDRFYSEEIQTNFESARMQRIETDFNKPPIDCTVELMQEFKAYHDEGRVQSVLALNSHDLTAYALAEYVKDGGDIGIGESLESDDSSSVIQRSAAILMTPSSQSEASTGLIQGAPTDSAHCFLVIGCIDQEAHLSYALRHFGNLDEDHKLSKLAVVDMYNRDVFCFTELQDHLNTLSNQDHRVPVANLNILDTSQDYRYVEEQD